MSCMPEVYAPVAEQAVPDTYAAAIRRTPAGFRRVQELLELTSVPVIVSARTRPIQLRSHT